MYINDLRVKEINQYYAQHGGRRTALIKGFANYMENAKTGRISAHTSSRITEHANSASAANSADAGNSSKTGINTRTARQTSFGSTAQAARQTTSGTTAQTARQSASKAQSDTEATGNSTTGNSRSQDYCCDKCQLTQQLMLRMMTNNLYTQSGLGYSAMGSGALAAYQSLSKYFGTGLFS